MAKRLVHTQRSEQKLVQRVFRQEVSSPIPPAEELKKLEPFISNAGERFMALYENNVVHHQNIDAQSRANDFELNKQALDIQREQLKRDSDNLRLGQWITFFIVVVIATLFLAAVWLYTKNLNVPASIFTCIAVLGGVWIKSIVKVYSSSKQDKKP